jgi:hypothetical protein
MKKIHLYILASTLTFMGVLTACTNENDWSENNGSGHLTRVLTPSDLSASTDSATLDITVKFKELSTKNTELTYEVQISESPLSEGIDGTPGIATFDGTGSPIVISRTNGQLELKDGTAYYLRLRAKDNSRVSKWVTDGTQGGYYQIKTPETFRIDDDDVFYNKIVLSWNKKQIAKNSNPHYCNIQSIKNVNTGNEEVLTDDQLKSGSFEWTGLTESTEYAFQLIDTDNKVIKELKKTTETKPNMDWARTITDLSSWKSGEAVELADKSFKITIADYGKKFKGDADKNAIFIDPLGNKTTKAKFYRFSTNTNAFATSPNDNSMCQIKMEIPAAGRLYVYTYGGSNSDIRRLIIKKMISAKKFDTKEYYNKAVAYAAVEKDTYSYNKICFTEAGTYYLSNSASIYFWRFVFVPDAVLND